MLRISPILVLILAGTVLAQEPTEKQPDKPPQPTAEQPVVPLDKAVAPELAQKQPQREVVWTITFPTELGISTGLVDHPGDVAVSRLGASINSAIPIGQRSELNLGFEYEFSHYDFKNATDFAPGTASPWRDIHREMLRVRFGTQETMQFSWLVGGAIGLSAEDGADLGKSISGNVYGGGAVNFSKDFKIGGAVVFYERMERSPLILP